MVSLKLQADNHIKTKTMKTIFRGNNLFTALPYRKLSFIADILHSIAKVTGLIP